MQLSRRCCTGSFRMNIRSCCTMLLNSSFTLLVATALGPGRLQLRHGRQVSTISCMMLKVAFGTPTSCKMRFMATAEACHHLICNNLRVRRTTPALLERRSCSDRPKSKPVQSSTCSGVVSASRHALRCLEPSSSAIRGFLVVGIGNTEDDDASGFGPSGFGPSSGRAS